MTKPDNAVYLQHILDAIATIESHLKDIEASEFFQNRLVQDGVIRQLEIIGEASKRISASLKKKHKNIPWKDMAGMRDKLIHDYFGVDLNAVWATATDDAPKLKISLARILKQAKLNL